jgi:hypothetical protein
LIYASLFGIGKLVFKEWGMGLFFAALAVVCAILISRNLSGIAAADPEYAPATLGGDR